MGADSSHIAILHRTSKIVSSGLAIDEILQELIAITVEVTGSDACLVYLPDRATGDVVLRASQLPHAPEIGSVRLKLGEGVTGWVAQHRTVVALARNASADSRFKSFATLVEDTYQAFLSVPLVSGGEVIGVLNVHHREPHEHTSKEISLLLFVGEQMRYLCWPKKMHDFRTKRFKSNGSWRHENSSSVQRGSCSGGMNGPKSRLISVCETKVDAYVSQSGKLQRQFCWSKDLAKAKIQVI
jgi:uroporphyrinogen-III synthase